MHRFIFSLCVLAPSAPLHAGHVLGSPDDLLVAGISVDQASTCAGGAISFTDASLGTPTAWSWTFPGGTPAVWVGPDPPPVVFNTAGQYSITLQISSAEDTDLATLQVNISAVLAAPLLQNFDGGFFPPQEWTLVPDGSPQPTSWSADFFPACGQATSSFVPGFNASIDTATPVLISPALDLSGIDDPYFRFRRSYAPRTAEITERLWVVARDCAGGDLQVLFQAEGEALATNGGLPVATNWFPQSCADWGTATVSLEDLGDEPFTLAFILQTTGGQNVFIDDVEVFEGVRLNVRVLLGGPYRGPADLMVDSLLVQGLLPLTEPYSALGAQLLEDVPGERAAGGDGPDALVDWVVVELRDALDPTQLLVSRVALVQRDGDVVDLDGFSLVRIGIPAGQYHVAVRHRNHLSVMSAGPVTVGPQMPLLDLSDPDTPTFGTDARRILGERALLWPGNSRGNAQLRYTGTFNDRDPLLDRIGGILPTATVAGYFPEDINLDGLVKYTGASNDRDIILNSIGGSIPTAVRNEQLP